MLKKIFPFLKRKKKRKSSLFQKTKKTQALYRKRKNFSIKLNNDLFQKIGYLYYSIGIASCAGLIYFLFFSPHFLIHSIKVQKQDNNSSIEIAYNVVDEFIDKNILLVDVSQIRRKLLESQENLGKVTVTKQFPKTLGVNLISYKDIYNSTVDEKEYLILSNGSLVPGKNKKLLTMDLKLDSFPRFYEYKKVLSQDELKNIYELEKLLGSNFVTTKLAKLNYYIHEKEVHFITEAGSTLIFDLLAIPKQQIEKLAVFHEENMQIDAPSLIYVDLRIKDKLYFCDTTNELSCYTTLNFLYGKER